MKGTLIYWTPKSGARDTYQMDTVGVDVDDEHVGGGLTFVVPLCVVEALYDAYHRGKEPQQAARVRLLIAEEQ